jgi:hypothetical protein
MSSNINLKNIDTVLAFLSLFLNNQVKPYEIQTEPLTLDPFCYSQEFHRFITTLYQENFVISFDWVSWQNEANHFITYPELLTLADISTLQKLLTTHVRKEHFCSGYMTNIIENGHFLAILKRLQVIRTNIIL